MAKIFPFKGILYNKEKIGDISKVTAPPYDVISNEQQDKYYSNHEFNIIRLILGKEHPGDDGHNNKYIRSADFMQKWMNDKIIVQDDEPCIYPYSQEYSLNGERKIQKGIICVLRLEEFSESGSVLPHEKTLAKPKMDRLQLIESCMGNLSPIFGMYSDPELHLENLISGLEANEPAIDIKDDSGTIHKLWRLSNPDLIREIQEILLPQKIYIADGHHRYETALAYSSKRRGQEENFKGSEPYNHIMIYLTNMDDRDLVILAAHRLIRQIPEKNPDKIRNKLNKFFSVKTCSSIEEVSILMKENHSNGNVFGMYDGRNLQFLSLKNRNKYREEIIGGIPEIYEFLDVTVAHYLILDHILNNGEKVEEDNLAYVKDMKKALDLVDGKNFAASVFLNPTKIEQVKAIASIGMKMPGKATYFHPKPSSGLLIHKF